MGKRKANQVLETPFLDAGGFGFVHDAELVWRAYTIWRAGKFERMPRRAEVEQIEDLWYQDMITASELVQFIRDRRDFDAQFGDIPRMSMMGS